MGAVASILFAGRNIDKCVNKHESTRGVVAGCQSISSADSIFSTITKGTGNILSKADGAVDSIFSKLGKTETLDDIVKTTGAGTKIGAVAQKAVNPLLCISAGVRVLNDEDQYAALIEETAAMGAMFGTEAIMKYARSAATGSKQATKGLAGVVAKKAGNFEAVSNLAKKATEFYNKLGSSKHGSAKQMILKAGIDLLFVAGSITAYNIGKKIGKVLSGRNNEESVQNTVNQEPQLKTV